CASRTTSPPHVASLVRSGSHHHCAPTIAEAGTRANLRWLRLSDDFAPARRFARALRLSSTLCADDREDGNRAILRVRHVMRARLRYQIPGGMMRAIWNDTVVAESDDTVVVEGNHYFPVESIRTDFFAPSDTTTVCGWKGTASYYSLTVDGQRNPD